MDREQFFATVTPALVTFMSVAIPALLAWLTAIVQRWASKQNEATDRAALHSALQSGVSAAEQKYAKAKEGNYQVEKVAYAIDYAQSSVPDAIRNLSPPKETLIKLAQAKLRQQEREPCPPDISLSPVPSPSADVSLQEPAGSLPLRP